MTRILYCNCAYARVIPDDIKREVLEQLARSGVAFEAVADLCELSARKSPVLKRLAAKSDRSPGEGGEPELRIAACFPRAVRWLFSAAGAPLPESGVEVSNMRTERAEDVVAALLEATATPTGSRRDDERKEYPA